MNAAMDQMHFNANILLSSNSGLNYRLTMKKINQFSRRINDSNDVNC